MGDVRHWSRSEGSLEELEERHGRLLSRLFAGMSPQARERAQAWLRTQIEEGDAAFWMALDEKDEGRARLLVRRISAPGAETLLFGYAAWDRASPGAERDFTALLQARIQAARQEGVRTLLGPIDASTWYAYRLRLDDGERQLRWEPPRDPEFRRILESLGFAPRIFYKTVASPNLAYLSTTFAPDVRKAAEAGYRFSVTTPIEIDEPDLRGIYDLSLRSFVTNPLFGPISWPSFARYYVAPLQQLPGAELALVHAPDGSLVAYLLGFPDEREGGWVYKTTAVDAAHRRQRLFLCMSQVQAERGLAQGLVHGIAATMVDDNPSVSITQGSEPAWVHRYAVFGLDL